MLHDLFMTLQTQLDKLTYKICTFDLYDKAKISRTVNNHLPYTIRGGRGALKAPPPPIFCSHAFNFGAALLCVGDFS